MSGTGRDYEALNRTQREVEGQRETGPHRNYEALRETQREIDARPAPVPAPEQQEKRNPYETIDERTAEHTRKLDALVKDGKINASEKIHREKQFDSELVGEMKLYDKQRARELEEAKQIAADVRAREAPEQTRQRPPEERER